MALYKRVDVALYSLILIFFSMCFCAACQGKDSNQQKRSYTKEELIEFNKHLVNNNMKVIEKFLEINGIEMQKSESGLWYQIVDKNTESTIKQNDLVTYYYQISLLDSTLCYSSEQDGMPKTITIGKGGEITGILEGLKLLSKDGKADLIIPPHLAYGHVGDDNKIPTHAILLASIHVIKVE